MIDEFTIIFECFYCGSKPETKHDDYLFRVCCRSCGCSGPKKETVEESVMEWNKIFFEES